MFRYRFAFLVILMMTLLAACSDKNGAEKLNGTWVLDYASIVDAQDKELSGMAASVLLGQVFLSFDIESKTLQWAGGGASEEAAFTLDARNDGSFIIHSRQKGETDFHLRFVDADNIELTPSDPDGNPLGQQTARFRRMTKAMMKELMEQVDQTPSQEAVQKFLQEKKSMQQQ